MSDMQRAGVLGRLGQWLGGSARAANHAREWVGELPVRLSSRDYARGKTAVVREMGFDQALLWVVVALLCWGLVMVYSASIALPDNPRFRNYEHTHFLMRHALALGIGAWLRHGWPSRSRCGSGKRPRPGCLRSRCC
jgi:cell division protein FtsW